MISTILRPRTRDRLTAVLAGTGVLTLLSGVMVMGSAGVASADQESAGTGADKVFVCKYVGTPGEDERLQTGDNPLSVSVNAIRDYQGVGSYFSDDQGRSFVLAVDDRTSPTDPEPPVTQCPAPDDGDDGDDGDEGDGKAPTTETQTETRATCEDGNQQRTRTRTVTYTWSKQDKDWQPVPGEWSAWSAWVTVSDLTAEQEAQLCEEESPDPVEVTPSVVFTDATCTDLDGSVIEGAADTDGIDYTVTGSPGLAETVTVVAVPKEGYVFPAAATTQWEHTFAGLDDLACDDGQGTDTVDVCPNLPGSQEAVPDGYEVEGGACVEEDDAAGVDTDKPAPGSGPGAGPGAGPAAPPSVQGVAEAVPTAVDAGLGGVPLAGTPSSPAGLLGQGLLSGGLFLMLMAGWLQRGRLTRGAHQF